MGKIGGEMSNIIDKVFVNRHGVAATYVGFIGALLSDAYVGKTGFVLTLILTVLILFLGMYSEQKKAKLYKNDIVPIPIVVSIDDNQPSKMLFNTLLTKIIAEEKQFSSLMENLEKYFNISDDMLIFKYEGDLYDQARLISFFQIIRYELNDIQNRLDNKAQFHVLYLRRPAYGFVLGGMFRTDGIVVYQNSDNKNIDKVAVIDSRQYKEKTKRYKKFDVIRNFNNKEDKHLLIVIQISSHDVSMQNKSLAEFGNTILLRSKGNGTIPTDVKSVENAIWIEYAQEIYNVINKIKSEYDDITIVHSMPEAITLIVGKALENYWDINIRQFDNSGYKHVINLKQIKYYF